MHSSPARSGWPPCPPGSPSMSRPLCRPFRDVHTEFLSRREGVSMDTVAKQRPTFEPPGPGSWDLDALHFPRPVTAYWAQMHPEPFSLGYADMMAFYGAPIRTRRTAYVNGFCYGQMEPVPPDSFPARAQRAQEVFAGKLWRDQATEWEEVRKPASVQVHHDIQAIEPEDLSDEALVEYLRR